MQCLKPMHRPPITKHELKQAIKQARIRNTKDAWKRVEYIKEVLRDQEEVLRNMQDM